MKPAEEDIVEGVRILLYKKIPPFLASPDQLRRCPGAGSTSQTASVMELQTKIKSLEKWMVDFMDSNKKTSELKKTM